MKIETFEMERMQSTWENRVEYNLSESGVHPMSLGELLHGHSDVAENLSHQELGYAQSNGTIGLRKRISALYPGSTPESIQVTNGTSEANFITIWNLVEDGDEVVFMLPNYMQMWGLSRGFKGVVRVLPLREETGWRPDLDELRRVVNSKTKLIAVCNPNNPTGAILTREEMLEIVRIADQAGAWLVADEVYLGAERNCKRTSSFWGLSDHVIVTCGLSKSYGLPGLRIGWIVAPPDLIAKFWAYHDYTTIGPSMLSDVLAQIALEPATRERIFARTRGILQTNYPVLHQWIQDHGDLFSLVEPQAGAIVYFRYNFPMDSLELVEKLLHEKSVLIVPGKHFGMDHYLRIGYGSPPDYIRAGLNRIHDLLPKLRN